MQSSVLCLCHHQYKQSLCVICVFDISIRIRLLEVVLHSPGGHCQASSISPHLLANFSQGLRSLCCSLLSSNFCGLCALCFEFCHRNTGITRHMTVPGFWRFELSTLLLFSKLFVYPLTYCLSSV